MADVTKLAREALEELGQIRSGDCSGTALLHLPNIMNALQSIILAGPAVIIGTWQPIGTTPKDSKARLVWCPERQNTFAVVWDVAHGWCIWGGWRKLEQTPTHWMPLPKPPEATD
jgi:hypothetical protein